MLYKLKIDELKLDRSFLSETSDEDKAKREVLSVAYNQVLLGARHNHHCRGSGDRGGQANHAQAGLRLRSGLSYDKPLCADDFDKKYMRGSDQPVKG